MLQILFHTDVFRVQPHLVNSSLSCFFVLLNASIPFSWPFQSRFSTEVMIGITHGLFGLFLLTPLIVPIFHAEAQRNCEQTRLD